MKTLVIQISHRNVMMLNSVANHTADIGVIYNTPIIYSACKNPALLNLPVVSVKMTYIDNIK